jgi:hypothetical protein
MMRDLVVAQPQQWELFSWNGPRKPGFLFASENSRREIGMLIFQRRTLIGQLIAPGSIFSSINPPPLGLVAQKVCGPDDAASTTRKTVRNLRMAGLKTFCL